MEADLAEERAKQLRTQAQEVAHRFGIKTDDMRKYFLHFFYYSLLSRAHHHDVDWTVTFMDGFDRFILRS
jgi:predicted solute-binding protein